MRLDSNEKYCSTFGGSYLYATDYPKATATAIAIASGNTLAYGHDDDV